MDFFNAAHKIGFQFDTLVVSSAYLMKTFWSNSTVYVESVDIVAM